MKDLMKDIMKASGAGLALNALAMIKASNYLIEREEKGERGEQRRAPGKYRR